jgi:exosortase
MGAVMAETKVLNGTQGGVRRTNVGRRQKAPAKSPAPKPATRVKPVVEKRPIDVNWVAWAVAIFLAGVWAYWPTLVEIVKAWNNDREYSHGYLVVPVALGFLYARRTSYPGIGPAAYGLGFGLFGLAMLMRYLGALFFYEFVDGYSILFWLAGSVAILGGAKFLWWSLPSIGFLFFMIPLPFGIATAMSAPLQRVSTKVTCWALQVLGEPAFAEGNVVLIGDVKLEVAQACSGLSLFTQFIALSYAYIVLFRRPWWEKLCLVAAIAPIAIIANSTRIVVVGLVDLYSTYSHVAVDDFVGKYVMIPLAAAMFGGLLWYMSVLIREEEVMDMSFLVRDVEA